MVAPEPLDSRRTSTVAVLIACSVWSSLAMATGLGLLALLAINHRWNDGDRPSMLFRLIVMSWVGLNNMGAASLPGMGGDPRTLTLFTNKDFNDAFLAGWALIALAFAAATWKVRAGVDRGDRRAFAVVGVVSLVACVTIVFYGGLCLVRGLPPVALAMLAMAAVPAILALSTLRRAILVAQPDGSSAGKHIPLTSGAWLFILATHAALALPALACAWVLLGVFARQVWLRWVS